MKPYDPSVDETNGTDWVKLHHATRLMLQALDPDPEREGLIETPERAAAAWLEWTRGYKQDPAELFKCFTDGACDEMVVVADLPFYSHCEHHLAPFFGSVTIGYVPDKKVLGLSKFARLVDIYAKRLQIQERMTNEIAGAIYNGISPLGVGVVTRARHLCVESRGVCKQGHHTVTSALRGCLREDAATRAEFLKLAHKYQGS